MLITDGLLFDLHQSVSPLTILLRVKHSQKTSHIQTGASVANVDRMRTVTSSVRFWHAVYLYYTTAQSLDMLNNVMVWTKSDNLGGSGRRKSVCMCEFVWPREEFQVSIDVALLIFLLNNSFTANSTGCESLSESFSFPFVFLFFFFFTFLTTVSIDTCADTFTDTMYKVMNNSGVLRKQVR